MKKNTIKILVKCIAFFAVCSVLPAHTKEEELTILGALKSPEQLITFIKEQLSAREPYYSKARYRLDVTLMDNYEKIKTTVAKLKELLR